MGNLVDRGSSRRWDLVALAIACLALFAALGGGVYAATKLDGHTIRAASLPGNRLIKGSVPGNRLRPGSVPADRLAAGSITGAQINPLTLGQVPSAIHAESAERARRAERAEVAEVADEASRLNGLTAGCEPGTRHFAGACWQLNAVAAPLEAPAAAAYCANQGGELPAALALAAFAQQSGVTLAFGDEWSGDIAVISGPNLFSVATVSASAVIGHELSTQTRRFRCVLPLLD